MSISTLPLISLVVLLLLDSLREVRSFPFTDVSLQSGLQYPRGVQIKYGGAAVADLDGDGHVDLVYAHHDNSNAEIYFNNGDGTFAKNSWHFHRDIHGINPYRHSVAFSCLHFAVSVGGSNGNRPNPPYIFHATRRRTIRDVTDKSGDVAKSSGRGRSALFVSLRRGVFNPVDVVFTNGRSLDGSQNRHKAFQGLEGGGFRQRDLPIFSTAGSIHATVTDVDNDRQPEIVSFYQLSMYRVVGDFKVDDITARVFPRGLDLSGVTSVAELDYDNDGLWDLYIARANVGPLKWVTQDTSRDYLLRNVGGRYEDVSKSAQLAARTQSRGVTVGDFNNDGAIDILVLQHSTSHLLLINRGDGTFFTRPSSLRRNVTSVGDMATAVDLDQDGRLDLVVSEGDWGNQRRAGIYRLLKNTGRHPNGLLVRVLNSPHRSATSLHAVVRVYATDDDNEFQMRRVGSPGTSVSNSLIEVVHFGIGERTKMRKVEVTWADGAVRTLYDVRVGSMPIFGQS